MLNKDKIYLSTIAPDAAKTARTAGVNLEIAEFCTAWNMDRAFPTVDEAVKEKIEGVGSLLLHAPFNELFPCAIDPKARELAAARFKQAIDLAKNYGAKKVVIHGGYNPWIYYPVWYVEKSIVFWKEFLQEDPGVELVLENVLEEDPAWLLGIVRGVDHPRLRMCLDIGHVNAYSKIPVMDWLEVCAPWVSHFHIHNNDGTADRHGTLFEGSIPMADFLHRAKELCPDATFTLELMEDGPSVMWLADNGFMEMKE